MKSIIIFVTIICFVQGRYLGDDSFESSKTKKYLYQKLEWMREFEDSKRDTIPELSVILMKIILKIIINFLFYLNT